MKIIKKKSLISLLLLTTFMFLGSVGFVFAAVTPPGGLGNLSGESVEDIIKNIVNWIAGIAALISALIIVIAGVMWATAGGDEEKQGKARKMLISGIVGLIIALAALAIVTVATTLL